MKNNEDNIYQLITDLCVKCSAHKDVTKIRTKCYEIILGKKYPQLSGNLLHIPDYSMYFI